ncbi:hypothetical protein [Butyrivibrio sp. TB]|uniref:hypothetical protein n=1 Tax=Butyrivibrio sp. TB TaxID=1520809 RepID=UPI0008BB3B32|nr:hypothetical protein [Butyrivibrio sp. TB]SEQ48534.1 hypothetical protein SAMN02910382_03175 [Butyrivibrio sp. TB]
MQIFWNEREAEHEEVCQYHVQAANSILTKGTLRGGGDTKFLMVADIIFLGFAAYHLELSPDLYLSGRDSMYI